MEKYGFVYIWYDRKHMRYYVGSHWGYENDGYICSSPWMLQAYKHRSQDFKRRIIIRNFDSRLQLLQEENRLLQMIKPYELKIKYYNLKNHEFGHWSTDELKSIQVKEKTGWNKGLTKETDVRVANQAALVSKTLKGRNTRPPWSEEQKKTNRLRVKEQFPKGLMYGRKHTKESKEKMRIIKLGKTSPRKGIVLTDETKRKISETKKLRQQHG